MNLVSLCLQMVTNSQATTREDRQRREELLEHEVEEEAKEDGDRPCNPQALLPDHLRLRKYQLH